MLKTLFKYLTISLTVLGALSMVGGSIASAQQSPSEFQMSKLRQAIKVVGLEVPDSVMRQLNDIVKETEDLYEISVRGKSAEYYKSDKYKSLKKREDDMWGLLLPYYEEAQRTYRSVPPTVYVDIPDLTVEQRTQHLLQFYRDEYESYDEPISYVDLQKLESAIREHRVTYQKLISLRSNKEGGEEFHSEHKALKLRMNELKYHRDSILSPYKRAYETKLIIGLKIFDRLSKPLTRDAIIDSIFDQLTKRYARVGITISPSDEYAYKSLLKESFELGDERILRHSGDNYSGDSPSQIHSDKSRKWQITKDQWEILKPYNDQATEFSLKTGFE